MSTLYNDGSAQAPAGTPLLPKLLSGYAVRPPWEVAGVDYAVGVPAGTILQNPATISMTGVTVDTATHTIYVTGSNVTLSGYDFGSAGGWGVYIETGVTNTVIENSNFLVGANQNVPISAAAGSGNLTVQDNTINGGGGQDAAVWALINYNGSGTFTAKYNSLLNAPEDAIDFSSGTMTTIVEYNLFENLGTDTGSHPDPVQYDAVDSTNSVEAFNTIYQPSASGMQGVQLQAQDGSTLTNTEIENNTIVAPGPTLTMSYSVAVIQNAGNTINGAVVANNYIDYSGAYGPFYPPSGSKLTFTDNINMTTGTAIANPSGTAPSDVTSVTASPTSATQDPGTTITLTLNMDQAEFVTGTPTLTLNDGGIATYTSGSGTSQLVFTYKVGSTDQNVTTLGITQVNLPNSAAVTDAFGSAATLSGAVTSIPGFSINIDRSLYTDGSPQVLPAGTPQLATLLNGYAARPPWEVAGVDYAVGIPTGTVLKNPATISMAGVSVNAATHTIYVTGSNVTLNGYDFSLAGGWGVYIESGATNTVIENSNFLVGANQKVPIAAATGAGDLSVQDNTINGGGGQNSAIYALISYSGSGTFTAKYNSFLNAPENAINFNSGTMTTVVEYNLFDTIGITTGSSANTVQYVGVKSNNSVEAYNTIYQPNASTIMGIQLEAQSGSTLTNTKIENNTIVAKGPSIDMSYSVAVIQKSGNTINGAVVANNYIDYSGTDGPFYPPSGSNLTFTGNINMTNGGQIASPKGTASSDVTNVTASPASGIQYPGTTVTLTLNMDQAEFVVGTPTLTLNDGGTATYTGGSGTNQLVFTYKVGSTDKTVTTLGITQVNLPNGATVTNTFGSSANLSGAVTTLSGLGIDPPAPGANSKSKVTTDGATTSNAVTDGNTVRPIAANTQSPKAMSFTTTAGIAGTDTIPACSRDGEWTGGMNAGQLTGAHAGYATFAELAGDIFKGIFSTAALDATALGQANTTPHDAATGANLFGSLTSWSFPAPHFASAGADGQLVAYP